MYDGIIAKNSTGSKVFTDAVLETALEMNGEKYVRSVKEEESVDNILFVIHVNKPGRSYCHWAPPSTETSETPETCVIYSKWEMDNDRDGELDSVYPAVYAHEILHTFGALDLYFPFDPNEDRKKLATEYFPNEVMLRTDREIYNLEIGEFTAHILGWTEEVAEEYKVFIGWL